MRNAKRVALIAGLGLALVAGTAQAVPITYISVLQPGVAVTDVLTQAAGNESNPVGADYFMFFASAGQAVNVFVDRLTAAYDPSFWVFSGIYPDTNNFGPSFPGSQAGNFVAFGDDQAPPNLPGPFGDPNVTFAAPSTGFYTVAVTNFLSGGQPPYDYRLQVNSIAAVPEPGSMILFGTGLASLVGGARRRLQKTRK